MKHHVEIQSTPDFDFSIKKVDIQSTSYLPKQFEEKKNNFWSTPYLANYQAAHIIWNTSDIEFFKNYLKIWSTPDFAAA